MKPIAPCLWFDTNAEEAVTFYCSVFKNSKITHISYCGEACPGEPGSVLIMMFELNGVEFTALNGGTNPNAMFNHAVSFMVLCDTQEEIDTLWQKLSQGGSTNQCGWLKDKFGVSWQITPRVLMEMQWDKDLDRKDRVMRAMMQMTKLDIAGLEKAYAGTE